MLGCLLHKKMSQKLSVLLLLFGLVWCLLLLRYTVTQPRRQTSAELRQQILELSRRYVKALSEENQNPSGPRGTSMAGYADLKRTIAVLLDDVLDRLVKLEGRVEAAVNASALSASHNSSHTIPAGPAPMLRTMKQDKPSNPSEKHGNLPETLSRPAKKLHLPRPRSGS